MLSSAVLTRTQSTALLAVLLVSFPATSSDSHAAAAASISVPPGALGAEKKPKHPSGLDGKHALLTSIPVSLYEFPAIKFHTFLAASLPEPLTPSDLRFPRRLNSLNRIHTGWLVAKQLVRPDSHRSVLPGFCYPSVCSSLCTHGLVASQPVQSTGGQSQKSFLWKDTGW